VQPGLIDNNCATNGANTVANLSQFYNLENATGTPADAAIALVVSNDVDPNGTILQLGGTNNGNQPTDGPPHAGSGITATLGEAVAKSGRSTGLTCASITSMNVEATVEYQKGCGTGTTFNVTYDDAISMGDGTFSAEGDSGSLVVDMNTADAVGLLFAGSDTDTIANPIGDVLAQMADPATSVQPTILGSANTHAVAACSLPGPQAAMAAALVVAHATAANSAMQQAAAGAGTPARVARIHCAAALAYLGHFDQASPVFEEALGLLDGAVPTPARLELTRAEHACERIGRQRGEPRPQRGLGKIVGVERRAMAIGHGEEALEEFLRLGPPADRQKVDQLDEQLGVAGAVLAHRLDQPAQPGQESVVADAQQRPARHVPDAGRLDHDRAGPAAREPGVPVDHVVGRETVVGGAPRHHRGDPAALLERQRTDRDRREQARRGRLGAVVLSALRGAQARRA